MLQNRDTGDELDVKEMSDEAIRAEYVSLMDNAIKMTGGVEGWGGAKRLLLDKGTSYSMSIVNEMDSRKIRGIAHEDGRFDYMCRAEWCRCKQ